MKRNEISKTKLPMMKKLTWIMVFCFTVFMAGMISLINNHTDQKGTRLSGYGLRADNHVKGPGYPDWSRTDK